MYVPPTVRLTVVPLTRDLANKYIANHHRHHGPVVGAVTQIGAMWGLALVGVAFIGRPVARGLQDGLTAEVTRLCTNGTANACSFLYAASWRAAKALGYRRLFTYTLASEPGTSLRAAGWVHDADVPGRSWSCDSRPRSDKHPTVDKIRWRAH